MDSFTFKKGDIALKIGRIAFCLIRSMTKISIKIGHFKTIEKIEDLVMPTLLTNIDKFFQGVVILMTIPCYINTLGMCSITDYCVHDRKHRLPFSK